MADIGDKLRSARKAKGMSIEDVEKITTDIPFLYCTYPDLDVVNDEITEDEEM